MDIHAVSVPLWAWGGFFAFIIAMLAIDLGLFHRTAHRVSLKEAAIWSLVWVSLAFAFAGIVAVWLGGSRALDFVTGYLVEWSLSVDNLFVFLVIFSYFAVPPQFQHRVLVWGILGAIIMRGLFIGGGLALIHTFHWIVYVFGAFLVFTGIKLAFGGGGEVEPEKNPVLRLARRLLPITEQYEGQRFLVRRRGRLMGTPLLLVVLVVESTDIVFAVDSVPAILAITQDPFIVYTSNIFAILGLRALFFLLAGVLGYFAYLKYGLSAVLVFIGVKMLIADYYKITSGVSLAVVAGLLGASMLASYLALRLRGPLPLPRER